MPERFCGAFRKPLKPPTAALVYHKRLILSIDKPAKSIKKSLGKEWPGNGRINKTRPKNFPVMVTSMAFFQSTVTTLQTLVVALGAGLGIWGVVNLLEGYGSDNPAAKSQGIKQLMAGGGIILLATAVIPELATLF